MAAESGDPASHPVSAPSEACRAAPGSVERIQTLRERVARAEFLWHPDDVRVQPTRSRISEAVGRMVQSESCRVGSNLTRLVDIRELQPRQYKNPRWGPVSTAKKRRLRELFGH